MKIRQVICSGGRTGFYFDDQRAIREGAVSDGHFYIGQPVTPGFHGIRQAGESISLMLVMEDGRIAWGDCAAVQYSGAGGRDPLFLAADFIPLIEKELAPRLIGRTLTSFREVMEEFEALRDGEGRPIHTAIRYGLSQAVLDAAAMARGLLPCELVAEEYGTEVAARMIPVFAQTGDERRVNADKMIIKEVDVLPHALINNIEKIGPDGGALADYVSWLRDRVLTFRRNPDYRPVFHIDVYGMIGQVFGPANQVAMVDYLALLADRAAPFSLRIEGPMDAGSRAAQIESLAALTEAVDRRGIPVELVADEWCNTLEDVQAFVDQGAGHMIQVKTPDLGSLHRTAEANLYCRSHGVRAYQGGTCNETDRSSRICVHVAMATGPDQILAKPGMGVDEGYMIVYNEMSRILALLAAR